MQSEMSVEGGPQVAILGRASASEPFFFNHLYHMYAGASPRVEVDCNHCARPIGPMMGGGGGNARGYYAVAVSSGDSLVCAVCPVGTIS